MFARRFGSWAGSCAIALVAACGTSADATSSDEAAVTNGANAGANQDPVIERITINKVCSYDGRADLTPLPGGDIVLFSSCGDANAPGRIAALITAKGQGSLLSAPEVEAHRARFAEGGALYWAAFDREVGPKSLRLHVRSLVTKTERDIPFFDPTLPESPDQLAKRLAAFDVKISPDGKTAVAYGYETKADGTYEGRIVIAPLDREGETLLTVTKGISPDADVTFSPAGDRLLILSTMSNKPLANTDAPRQFVYEVALGDAPKVIEAPNWVLQGHTGEVTVVPGSFDGTEVLRWDSDPKSNDGAGRVSIARMDGTQVELSKDAGVTSHAHTYTTDAEMHDPSLRAAFWVSASDPASPVIFPGAVPDQTGITLFGRERDGKTPASELVSDAIGTGEGFVTANDGEGIFVYPSAKGLGVINLRKGEARALIELPAGAKVEARALSAGGRFALVKASLGDEAFYVSVATENGAVTPLDNVKDQALRFQGPIEGDWADAACGYDALAGSSIQDDGTVVMLSRFATKDAACKRAYAAPELLSFSNGARAVTTLPHVALPDALRAKAPAPSFELASPERAFVSQCAQEDGTCTTFMERPGGFDIVAGPVPPTQPTDPAKPTTPTKPTNPAKPTKPSTSTGSDDGDLGLPGGGEPTDDTQVVVKKRPSSSPTSGETTSTSSTSTDATTKTVSTGGCSTAPGSRGPAGFGLAFLLGLAALRRRRRGPSAGRRGHAAP